MTTYFSVLVVLCGIALLWKAVSLSGEHFLSSKLSRLRDKAGMLSLDNAGMHEADSRETKEILESCQFMVDNFSIRTFLVALTAVRKNKTRVRNTHVYSSPEFERISRTALKSTLSYLPMLSPSLFLILLIIGGAMFFREGYGVTRQTLSSAGRSFAEYAFVPVDESQRFA